MDWRSLLSCVRSVRRVFSAQLAVVGGARQPLSLYLAPPLELLCHAAPSDTGAMRLKCFWVLRKTVFANIFPKGNRKWAAHPNSVPSPTRLVRDSILSHIISLPFFLVQTMGWKNAWKFIFRNVWKRGVFWRMARSFLVTPLYVLFLNVSDLFHIPRLIHKYTIVQCKMYMENTCVHCTMLSAARFISFQLSP